MDILSFVEFCNENNFERSLTGMDKYGMSDYDVPGELVAFLFENDWKYFDDRGHFTKDPLSATYYYVKSEDGKPIFRIDGEVTLRCEILSEIKKFIENIDNIIAMIEKIDGEEDWTEEEKEEGVRDNLRDDFGIDSYECFISY